MPKKNVLGEPKTRVPSAGGWVICADLASFSGQPIAALELRASVTRVPKRKTPFCSTHEHVYELNIVGRDATIAAVRLSASSDAASPPAPPRSPPWRQRRTATTTRPPATAVRFGKLGKEARAPITAGSSPTSPANNASSPTRQLGLRRQLRHSLWMK
jgi:hypothetical protein